MKKLCQDDAWEEYLYWKMQGGPLKVIKTLMQLIVDTYMLS